MNCCWIWPLFNMHFLFNLKLKVEWVILWISSYFNIWRTYKRNYSLCLSCFVYNISYYLFRTSILIHLSIIFIKYLKWKLIIFWFRFWCSSNRYCFWICGCSLRLKLKISFSNVVSPCKVITDWYYIRIYWIN